MNKQILPTHPLSTHTNHLTASSQQQALSLSELSTTSSGQSYTAVMQGMATAVLMSVMLFLVGCSAPESNDTADTTAESGNNVTIMTNRGEVSVPRNPKPVAVYDMSLMQDLAALGVEADGLPDNLLLDNLTVENAPAATPIGTLFEPDLEALNAMQPQVILIGGRMASNYDQLSSLAPTLDMSINTDDIYASSMQQLLELGELFDKEEQAKQLKQNIDDAIAETQAATEGQGNGLAVMVNGNKLSAYGPQSRYGYLHSVFNIPAADPNIVDSNHGQPISFEYLQQTDPDWIFVLDRGAAIGEEGANAKAVLDNPLVHQTKAWKNGHIVYLSPDSYLAYGGYYQWLKEAKTIKDAFSHADSAS